MGGRLEAASLRSVSHSQLGHLFKCKSPPGGGGVLLSFRRFISRNIFMFKIIITRLGFPFRHPVFRLYLGNVVFSFSREVFRRSLLLVKNLDLPAKPSFSRFSFIYFYNLSEASLLYFLVLYYAGKITAR